MPSQIVPRPEQVSEPQPLSKISLISKGGATLYLQSNVFTKKNLQIHYYKGTL
jgi:hypothetical protein